MNDVSRDLATAKRIKEALHKSMEMDVKEMDNRMANQGNHAEIRNSNPKVDEDEQRALKGLLSDLEVAIKQKGYVIESNHDGISYIVHKDGPYPNSIIALSTILKKEGIL